MASHFRHRTFGSFGAVFVLVGMATLAACGGTAVPPTANDFATVAAARTATANVAPTTAGGSGTAVNAGITASRGFGGLLTPAAQGAAAPARGTVTTGAAPTRGAGAAGGTAQGNALNPCSLVPVLELNRAMGETVRQASVENEKPVTATAELAGYSNASCAFAATASMQANRRGVIIETIRPTPAPAPTGMTALSFGDLWTTVSQEVQQGGINTSPVNGVGDEAIAFDDPDGSGDSRIYVRKGNTLLHVVVIGYATDGRTKAIEVARQAASKL